MVPRHFGVFLPPWYSSSTLIDVIVMGPQSDVKNWQNSAAAVQKENKRVEVLKF